MGRVPLATAIVLVAVGCGGDGAERVRATAFTIEWPTTFSVFTTEVDVPGDVQRVVLGTADLREGKWVCVHATGGGQVEATDGGSADVAVGGGVRARFSAGSGRVIVEIDNTDRPCGAPVAGELEVVGTFRDLDDPTWSSGAVLWTEQSKK
jgi:hypothetical protein